MVYNRLRDEMGHEVYDDLLKFQRELQDETSELGRILSIKSIRQSADRMERAEIIAMVCSGNGVYIGDDPEIRKAISEHFDLTKKDPKQT
ncbi:MAG: hypothetical protein AABX17_01935 [Nanoarchaeota archaeon]